MPNLRDTLDTISGVDIGGNEFTLQETDIQPYIDNPEIAQMEADVTKARWGGTSIQDPSPSDPQQGVQNVSGPDKSRNIDFSRRGDFENHVFNQLKSENIPDGNPFNFNPNISLNKISKQDLPQLFEDIFRKEVTWQDRHLLDDDQKKFWMSEVKRYRAHIQAGLQNERATAVNQYNQMMNSFDNAAKEQAAAGKLQREKRKQIREAEIKALERKGNRQKDYQTNLALKKELLSDQLELIREYQDAETAGTLTPETTAARLAELDALSKQLSVLNASIQSHEALKPKSKITPVKTTPSKPKSEKNVEGKTVIRGKIPKQGQKKVVRTATHKGNKVLIYSDGSKAYADEVE
jgi:hypothetical protein